MAPLNFDPDDTDESEPAARPAPPRSPGLALARAQLSAPRPAIEPMLAVLGAAVLFAAGAVLLATAMVMGPPNFANQAEGATAVDGGMSPP